MQRQKRILICPLDWGLGHATRCIPIINLLLQKNAQVIIAADGRSYELLKQEFPTLEFIRLKGYNIRYPVNFPIIGQLFFSVFSILKAIKREHSALQQIIKEYTIDTVIADNRFGLWNKDVKTIFITHQLMIKTPFAEKCLHYINLKYIKKFNECWVPDVEDNYNLSGDLSHKYILPKHVYFIGILSRFGSPACKEQNSYPFTEKYEVMVIISGPEPQRTAFEKIILEQLSANKLNALVVTGITEQKEKRIIKTATAVIEIVSHLKAHEMEVAILQAPLVIARSGYSTIMDMAALGKKVLFIPTPGQTEQEYLAQLFMDKKIAYMQTQKNFNLKKALIACEQYSGFEAIKKSAELEKRITMLCEQ